MALAFAWEAGMPLIAALNVLQMGKPVKRAAATAYLYYGRAGRDEPMCYWLIWPSGAKMQWEPTPEDLVATDYIILEKEHGIQG